MVDESYGMFYSHYSFSGLFIAGENIAVPGNRKERFMAQIGLWQRLSLAMMYLPYVILGFYIV